VGSKGSLAVQKMKGSTLLRSGFGEHKTPVNKIKGYKVPFSSKTSIRAPPVKTPGNHQMNEEPEFVFKANSDTLTDPLQIKYFFVVH
jgi:hypothetical protein